MCKTAASNHSQSLRARVLPRSKTRDSCRSSSWLGYSALTRATRVRVPVAEHCRRPRLPLVERKDSGSSDGNRNYLQWSHLPDLCELPLRGRQTTPSPVSLGSVPLSLSASPRWPCLLPCGNGWQYTFLIDATVCEGLRAFLQQQKRLHNIECTAPP